MSRKILKSKNLKFIINKIGGKSCEENYLLYCSMFVS